MRLLRPMITRITCSTMRMVMPCLLMSLMSSMASSVSFGLSPVRSSSSRSILGFVARALASCTRRSSMTFRFLARRLFFSLGMPTNSRSCLALSVGLVLFWVFVCAKSAPVSTFSSVVMSGNDCTVWLVLVIPRAQILYGGSLDISLFWYRILPESGL